MNAFGAALAIALLCPVRAVAAPPERDLIVATVRDTDGMPIVDANVRALAADGTVRAEDRSDASGTVALAVARDVSRVEVRCRYCRSTSVALGDETNLAIVVLRYRAVANDALASTDLDVLPYGRPRDSVALVPYVFGGGDGAARVSDRGLGGGAAVVTDDGAPVPYLAAAATGFENFPDRYARRVDVVRADRAFIYGVSGGAGRIALDGLDTATRARVDAGATTGIVIAPVIGSLHAGSGVSDDDGTIVRRADVDLVSGFAGGELRIGATTASDTVAAPSSKRHVDGVRLGYVTASRRYRTSADASAMAVDFTLDRGGAIAYRARYFDADVRVEHPGPMTFAAGLRTSVRSFTYTAPTARFARDVRTDDETAYVEAQATTGVLALHVALGGDRIGIRRTGNDRTNAGALTAFAPEVDARLALGAGAYARVAYAQSARVGGDGTYSGSLERAALLEGAFGIDSGDRIRGEVIAYREATHDAASRELVGVGASLAWELAPRLSLRAWTLHATPSMALPYALGFDAMTRGVAWLSYETGAVRIDAIAHRDVVASRSIVTGIDGDVDVRVASSAALNFGSYRRGGIRRYTFGLRVH